MTGDIFSQIIPLMAAMALPFPVIKATRLLLAGKPVAHSILFISTWGVICFLVLSTSIIFKEYLLYSYEIIEAYTPHEDISGWMHIILGLLFMGIGIKKIKLVVEHDEVSQPRESLELTPITIVWATLKIELFQVKNGLLLSLVIYILLKSQLPIGQSLIASAMISISGMICVSMPLIVYFWAGSQRDTILEELKIWLIKNNSTLVIFIYLFIGISTLSSGIGELLPELLEIIYQSLSS
ncbi:MAG: hypothetical protein ACI8PB_005340 [Desulforhopalus sp.]|jgi:hypothetical protein